MTDDHEHNHGGEVERRREVIDEHKYKLLALAAFSLLLLGTVVFRALEDWSWVDSLYYSTIAVTTVGFGDFTPTSDASKLFTVLYVLTGITIVTTYLNERLRVHAQRRQERQEE